GRVRRGEVECGERGAGRVEGTEAREAAEPLRISPLQYVQDPITPRIFWAVTFAAALGVTLGWRTRWMSILLYLGMLSLYHRNVMSNGGAGAGPVILAFYMMFCPRGAGHSPHARPAARESRTAAGPPPPPPALRVPHVQ